MLRWLQFLNRLPKKDPWHPQKMGWQKHVEIWNLIFFPETSMLAPIQTTGSPRLTLSRTTAAWLWKKLWAASLFFFCFDPRSGDVRQWWENSYVKNGLLWHCSGWLQKKRGLSKKGKLTDTPWKTFPRGYVYPIVFHVWTRIANHHCGHEMLHLSTRLLPGCKWHAFCYSLACA